MRQFQPAESSDRIPRHEHRVRAFSRNYELITGIGDRYAVERGEARALVRSVAEQFGVPMPDLAFNRRRRPDTGECWPPRSVIVETNSEERVTAWESHRQRAIPEHGQIRLGHTTMLRTIAHELGHHLVHHLEPKGTPAHGKVWVGRLDDAMETIARRCRAQA
jgi:predicted SprT family Zn-dependent metalloprotease